MKIVGLVTEYNPFHNGHKYHIEQAKKITGADYCIAVMSGNFVQRGAPAFLPKHLRTEMALDGGCDLVLELPVCFATGSAEYFASGAISILDSLGCVDAICFGSECGDYHTLENIARILMDEPDEYRKYLHLYLKDGLNYPLARQYALKKYFQDESIDAILEEPNNILGIEYIKALLLRKSPIKGYTIKRIASSYHDNHLSERYSSATAIRNILSLDDNTVFQQLNNQLPLYSKEILEKNYQIRYPVISDDFSLLLRYRLLSETRESLVEYIDINVDLANRIMNLRNEFLSFSQFCELLKTKELTYSRISRCLIHILLNIKSCDISKATYARVLGFRKKSSNLFTILKDNSRIPLLTKLTANNSLDEHCLKLISQDIFASDLYESVISSKFQKPFINELQQQIIKL